MPGPPFTAYSPVPGKPGLYRFERGTKPPVELYGVPAEQYRRQIDQFNAQHTVADNAHQPAPKEGLSFEAYDTKGVVKPVAERAPNRAMAQRDEGDVRGKPAADAGVLERWNTEKLNTFARDARINTPLRLRLERENRDNPKAGSATGTAARKAVTGVVDTALLPYRGARALSGGRLPELSAEQVYAEAESLARDEPTAATRERERIQDAAHPYAGSIGEGVGRTADPLLAAQAMKAGLRLGKYTGVPRMDTGLVADEAGLVSRTVREGGHYTGNGKLDYSLVRKAGPGDTLSVSAGTYHPDAEAEKIIGFVPDNKRAHALLGQPRTGRGTSMQTAIDYDVPLDEVRTVDPVTGRATVRSVPKKEAVQGVRLEAAGADDLELKRTFRRDERGDLVASNDLMRLPKEARGSGEGTRLLRNQLEEYDRLGVDRIELQAAWDGRYVWPKMGYQVDADTLKSLNKKFNALLKKSGIEPVKARSIQDIANHPQGETFLKSVDQFPMHLDMHSPAAEAMRARLGVPQPADPYGLRAERKASRGGLLDDDRGGVRDLGALKSARAKAADAGDYKEFQRLEREISDASHAAANPPLQLAARAEPEPMRPIRPGGPLPAFDRRIANAPSRGEPAAPSPARTRANTTPGAALDRNAQRRYRNPYHGDPEFPGEPPMDERKVEQYARARRFWAENPDYVTQAEDAAEFIRRHPDAEYVKRATSGNYGLNTELRTHGARMKATLESEPNAPRKDTFSGEIVGGTSGARLSPDTADRAHKINRILSDAVKAGYGYRGPVARGVRLPQAELDKWLKAGYVDQRSMWSGTANTAAAGDFAGKSFKGQPAVELRLNGKSGVPIEGVSEFPHEHEIAFPPGRRWKITGKSETDGRVIIDLEEVDRIPAGVDAPHAAIGTRTDRRAV